MTATISRRSSQTARTGSAPWKHVDVSLVGAVLAVSALGVLMVYSATARKLEAAGASPYQFLIRQALFVVAGTGVAVVVAAVDYRTWRDHAPVIYGASVFTLLLVLSPLGSSHKGDQGWFQLAGFQLQPSELAKVALIVCLAAYCANERGSLDIRRLGTVLVLAAVPMALIELQPDLGTDLVFLAVLMAMLLVGGAKGRHMAVLVGLGVVGIVAVLQLGVLKQYQVDRLGAFLDPAGDTQRSTYNLNQSKVAIAHGGFTGQGLFKGTQTNLSYVPEQHTDFIFTVVGEELGLLGTGTLLLLFGFIVWRMWRAAALAKDLSGTLICVGALAMFVFQVFENVGMTMGIMPITGIPLPFVSYGGSSMLTCFAATGLVVNVHMRRFT